MGSVDSTWMDALNKNSFRLRHADLPSKNKPGVKHINEGVTCLL